MKKSILRVKRSGKKSIAINFVTDVDRTELQDLLKHYHTNMSPMPDNIGDFI